MVITAINSSKSTRPSPLVSAACSSSATLVSSPKRRSSMVCRRLSRLMYPLLSVSRYANVLAMFSCFVRVFMDSMAAMNSSRSRFPVPLMSRLCTSCLSSEAPVSAPVFSRPDRSSSTVMAPSSSVSNLVNRCLSRIISESFRHRVFAIAMSPIFLNLFADAKFFIRASTPPSRVASRSALPFSRTQRCSRTSLAHFRVDGSGFRHIRITSLAASLTLCHGSLTRSYGFFTSSSTSASVGAQKGELPDKRMYRMTPADQTSAPCE
mmetsp:Transcript_37821/g.94039  ORF Transcript_37821/g.94039 Transcript_37821/m.94039 type:complete len:265 (+) Transcript_37821:382-1176(+)